MNDETFVKYLKELYPNCYESMSEEFEKYERRTTLKKACKGHKKLLKAVGEL